MHLFIFYYIWCSPYLNFIHVLIYLYFSVLTISTSVYFIHKEAQIINIYFTFILPPLLQGTSLFKLAFWFFSSRM